MEEEHLTPRWLLTALTKIQKPSSVVQTRLLAQAGLFVFWRCTGSLPSHVGPRLGFRILQTAQQREDVYYDANPPWQDAITTLGFSCSTVSRPGRDSVVHAEFKRDAIAKEKRRLIPFDVL